MIIQRSKFGVVVAISVAALLTRITYHNGMLFDATGLSILAISVPAVVSYFLGMIIHGVLSFAALCASQLTGYYGKIEIIRYITDSDEEYYRVRVSFLLFYWYLINSTVELHESSSARIKYLSHATELASKEMNEYRCRRKSTKPIVVGSYTANDDKKGEKDA